MEGFCRLEFCEGVLWGSEMPKADFEYGFVKWRHGRAYYRWLQCGKHEINMRWPARAKSTTSHSARANRLATGYAGRKYVEPQRAFMLTCAWRRPLDQGMATARRMA